MASNVLTFPYDTIVRITDTIGTTQYQASGVLISPDEVLTASHVVFTQGIGTATNIVVTPGYSSGSSPYGSADGSVVHYVAINDANQLITNQQSQSDYAVIHLATPFTSIGFMGVSPDFAGGAVTVSGYPSSANGAQIDSAQTVTRSASYTLLNGTALGLGSSGGPVWIETAAGPEVVGIVSAESTVNSTGYNVLLTTAALTTISGWVTQDDGANTPGSLLTTQPLTVQDTTTGKPVVAAGQPYTGPVQGLTSEYVAVTNDSLNITVKTPNWFIHAGGGTDAIAVSSGTNVLDGSTGSNFLTGGIGSDTFFVDDRTPAADIWSTMNNFHSGDAATVFGVTQSGFSLSWADSQGATGYTGLTLHATAAGVPAAALTLVGFTTADLTNNRLSITFGTNPATSSAPANTFMYIHAN